MSKDKSKNGLRGQIEKSYGDDTTLHPEDFVRPLVEEISVEVVAPKIDLRTAESARASIEVLRESARQLQEYQEKIHRLRPLLEQRRFELGDGDPE